MKVLISEKLSPHRYKTPEGYLICTNAILARTGKQTYRRSEIFNDDDDTEIEIDRPAEEVFSASTLASFENKPVVVEHPDEDVNAENHNKYAVGFARDVRRGVVDDQDVMLATIVITDAQTIEEIENGEHTDLSCGYDCDINDDEHPCQRNIRGNHIALCQHGRAGIARLVDSVKDVQSSKLGDKVRFRNRAYVIIKVQKGKSDDVARLTLRPLERFDEKDKPFEGGGDSYWDIHVERWQLDDSVKDSFDIEFDLGFRKTKESYDNRKDADERYDELIRLSKKPSMRGMTVKKLYDTIHDAKFEICYIDNDEVCIAIEAKDENDARQKFRKRYGMYYIKHIRKVKDGVKDMKVSHDNIREQPIHVMQSNVDKNLFFYIGKTHAMKEGEFTYAQYDMEGMTPDELRKELEANGWHKVSKGPAPFIDEDPYKESTEDLEEVEKNLYDEMIRNTDTVCKDELQTFRIGFDLNVPVTLDVKATDVKSAIEKAKRWAKAHNYDDTLSFREVKTKGNRHYSLDAIKDAFQEEWDPYGMTAEEWVQALDNAHARHNIKEVELIYKKSDLQYFNGDVTKAKTMFNNVASAVRSKSDAYSVQSIDMVGPVWKIKLRMKDTKPKDAKTEYVFNYRDTYHGTRDKMRVDAKNLDEAIREFGKTMALGGFGTANIFVVSVSPNDGYMRAYGKLSEMLKQRWTKDSCKKLDSKQLLSIVKAAKSIKSNDAQETKLTFTPANDFVNIDMTNALIGKLASSGIHYHSPKKNAGKYSIVIIGDDNAVHKARLIIENIGFFSKWS